jgi:hypothetical protein
MAPPSSPNEQRQELVNALLEKQLSAALTNLSKELEDERAKHRKDMFLAVLCIVILVNALIFSRMETWAGPVMLTVLQVVALVVFGKRQGIDDISVLIDRLIDAYRQNGAPAEEPKADSAPQSPPNRW